MKEGNTVQNRFIRLLLDLIFLNFLVLICAFLTYGSSEYTQDMVAILLLFFSGIYLVISQYYIAVRIVYFEFRDKSSSIYLRTTDYDWLPLILQPLFIPPIEDIINEAKDEKNIDYPVLPMIDSFRIYKWSMFKKIT